MLYWVKDYPEACYRLQGLCNVSVSCILSHLLFPSSTLITRGTVAVLPHSSHFPFSPPAYAQLRHFNETLLSLWQIKQQISVIFRFA